MARSAARCHSNVSTGWQDVVKHRSCLQAHAVVGMPVGVCMAGSVLFHGRFALTVEQDAAGTKGCASWL